MVLYVTGLSQYQTTSGSVANEPMVMCLHWRYWLLLTLNLVLDHQYDIFAVVPQTPIPCETTVVVVLQILDCFLSYKKNENCNLLFCRMLYFLGHVAGCSSSCGRRTWMEWWPVLSQSTHIIWYWQTTPWKRVRGNRSPNKGHIGQEMARKFGLLCLVQVSNFVLQ